MRVYEQNEKGLWLRPSSAEGYFISRLGRGHSVGRHLLLMEVDPGDAEKILSGDPEALHRYMEPVPELFDHYRPLGRLGLYDVPSERPVVVHDEIIEATAGGSSLPVLASY